MQEGWNVVFNVLTVCVSVCGGRGLSRRTFVQQVSPSGRASTGESLPASRATSPLVIKHRKVRKTKTLHMFLSIVGLCVASFVVLHAWRQLAEEGSCSDTSGFLLRTCRDTSGDGGMRTSIIAWQRQLNWKATVGLRAVSTRFLLASGGCVLQCPLECLAVGGRSVGRGFGRLGAGMR